MVAGSDRFRDWQFFKEYMNSLWDDLKAKGYTKLDIIQCGGRGADWMAAGWAEDHFKEVTHKAYPAYLQIYGQRALFVRNERLFKENKDINLVLIFGKRKGDTFLIQKAESQGVPSIVVVDEIPR